MTKESIQQAIIEQGVLPLFYHDDADTCLLVVRTLYRAGIRVVEFTNRGANALANYRTLADAARAEMPGLVAGIGTIKTAEEAEAFEAAGAQFFVSPVFTAQLADFTAQRNKLWIPGCMTPTEIFTARQHGIRLVKLFPANVLGPSFVNAVRELFPDTLFIPTGGVKPEAENLRAWFGSGVCAVGIGSQLITKDVAGNSNKLFAETERLLNIIQSIR